MNYTSIMREINLIGQPGKKYFEKIISGEKKLDTQN
jgi:hypothetical protein